MEFFYNEGDIQLYIRDIDYFYQFNAETEE